MTIHYKQLKYKQFSMKNKNKNKFIRNNSKIPLKTYLI